MTTKKTIEERAQDFCNAVFDKDLLHLMDVADGLKNPNKRKRGEHGFDAYYPEEWAREQVEGYAYGIYKETVYYVTLAGGGPAARLKVTLDEYGEIETATLQFCDWFEPWTDAPHQDSELVERYARLLDVGAWAEA
jgi:hypothetical protein